ncbi:MAG: hypothetical protein E6R04_04805 [Spirochaetes bacterium]|nr:MAG: hypothetical protein E6R04_04805 [Spirochaetota bacterium]
MKTSLKDLKVDLIREEDFVEVSEWFVRRKWPVPPAGQMLPPSGYVAYSPDGMLHAVAWLYVTNSQIGIIDWIATNPESEGMVGLVGVKKIIDHIERIATDISVFMHFTPNDSFARYLKGKCRFKITEKANILTRRRASLEVVNG